MGINSNEQTNGGGSESHWDPATTCSLSETNPSQHASARSPFLLALQRIRGSVRQARALVKEAFEHSTDVYWDVPTVDLSEELWEVFHPLMTIGDRLDSMRRELEQVDVGYQQFIALQQPQDGVKAALQETFVDPASQQDVQQLPFVVHVTIGTRFGRLLSAHELSGLIERYRGQPIEQHAAALQGTTRSVVSFFADLREVAPALADDLSEEVIGFFRMRKPSLCEYPSALRVLHQQTAERLAASSTEDQQEGHEGERAAREGAEK